MPAPGMVSHPRGADPGGKGTDQIRAEIHSKGSTQALGCSRAGLRGAGDRRRRGNWRGSVRNKRTFWLNSLAPQNMTGSVVRICQRNTPKPHSMDRPLDRAAGRAQRDLDLRAHSRGALALGAGPPPAAAHAAHRVEPWSWNSTNVGTLARLPRCGRPGPLWRAPGPVRAAVRRRARRPAPPDPPCSVFLHESGRYPRYVGPQGQLREQGQKVLAS